MSVLRALRQPISASMPSSRCRARDSSMKRSRLMRGMITERFGSITSAPSAIRRLTASRTGMALVPSRAASVRSDTASPGVNMPPIRPRASA